MKVFRLVISTPNGNIYDADAVRISLRGSEGELAVMANHIPFVTSVKPCRCRIALADGTVKEMDTGTALLSVTSEKVILMSGSAKWA